MSQHTMKVLSECIPVFTMLQEENRQHILVLLFDRQQMTVTELTESLSISRPAVSHHLKLLYDAGLVSVEKKGKERLYSLKMEQTVALLKELLASIEADMSTMPEQDVSS